MFPSGGRRWMPRSSCAPTISEWQAVGVTAVVPLQWCFSLAACIYSCKLFVRLLLCICTVMCMLAPNCCLGLQVQLVCE